MDRLKEKLLLYVAFTVAGLKAYSRNPVALFFSLVFPAGFMLIFGVLDFGGDGDFSTPDVGIVDRAQNVHSRAFTDALTSTDALSANLGEETEFRTQLSSDDLDVLLIIPADFTLVGTPNRSELGILYSAPRFTELGVTQSVVSAILSGQFIMAQQIPSQFLPNNYFFLGNPQAVAGADDEIDITYVLFLIPGILGMAAMQTSIFGSVFTLMRFKISGILKRLQATPAGPIPLIISQSMTTVVTLILSTLLLMIVGAAAFGDFRELLLARGAITIISVFLLIVLGGSIFIAAGLAISGVGKSEEAAAAVANLVTVPMLFLSGVFFSTDVLPDWLSTVTVYLPLSFMIDSLREVMLDGDMLWDGDVAINILGMAAWSLALFVVARFTFRWS